MEPEELEKKLTELTSSEEMKKPFAERLAATGGDLRLKAHVLAHELICRDFFLQIQVSRSEINYRIEVASQLDDVLNLEPSLEPEIQEKLELGWEENKRAIREWDAMARAEAPAAKPAQAPEPVSSDDDLPF